jgi:hypothetical protein
MTARIPENVPLGCSTVSIIGDTPPRDPNDDDDDDAEDDAARQSR